MKKYILVVGLLSFFALEVFAKFTLIQPVRKGYYDKTAEAILKPLRNCSYVVDFEFYGHPVKSAGINKEVRRKLPSTLPKKVVRRIVLDQNSHYDGYHKEEHYKYFLVQVPPKGYMQINYVFVDRMGRLYLRSEKIFNPKYHQIFPSNKVIPRACRGGRYRLR